MRQTPPYTDDGSRRLGRRAVLAGIGAATLAAPAMGQGTDPLGALIRAAQAEGALTFYSAAPESAARRAADGFFARYGIRAQFLRISSNPLQQRYAAEADSGNFACDVVIDAGLSSIRFAEAGIAKGWVEPIADAGLPVLASGEYPARFKPASTAIVQIQPFLAVYNTENVKPADLPRVWTDLLDPKWKRRILLPDPRTADAYMSFWAMILENFGPDYIARLRAQEYRLVAGGVVANQNLAAGEGSFVFPQIWDAVSVVRDKGGPIATFTPDLTTGVELQVMLTHRAKAKHPAAARLFANYLMSREGNLVINNDANTPNIYELGQMPKQYRPPVQADLDRKAEVLRLFGF